MQRHGSLDEHISAVQRLLVSQAASRKSTWKICRRLVCFGGESKDALCRRAEKKLEFAHYCAELGSEGARRFARESAYPLLPTLIFERLGCCGCIRAVGCYAGQTLALQGRPNGVIRQANSTALSPTGRTHSGLPTRRRGGSHEALLQLPGDGIAGDRYIRRAHTPTHAGEAEARTLEASARRPPCPVGPNPGSSDLQ